MRNFDTGATRDSDENKFDYEGFINPLVLERFAAYMHKHRFQADGKMRDSDNWQKGIPKDAYMKSMFRHFMDVWKNHRGIPSEDLEESLAALMFNVMGYLYETMKENDRDQDALDILTGFQNSEWLSGGIPTDNDPAFAYVKTSELPADKQSALDANTHVHIDTPGRLIDRLGVRFWRPEALDFRFHEPFTDHPEVERAFDTHRYGELAHDAATIAEEEYEGPLSTFHQEDLHCEAPYPHASVYSVPGMERSEVLGFSPQRSEGEVATVASEVRGVEPGETSLCDCDGCKWESGR